eukprot:scaffold7404_cov135-Isochrysis_galbana.AAC.3
MNALWHMYPVPCMQTCVHSHSAFAVVIPIHDHASWQRCGAEVYEKRVLEPRVAVCTDTEAKTMNTPPTALTC